MRDRPEIDQELIKSRYCADDYPDGRSYYQLSYIFNDKESGDTKYVLEWDVDSRNGEILREWKSNDFGLFPVLDNKLISFVGMPRWRAEEFFDMIVELSDKYYDHPVEEATSLILTMAVLKGFL